MMAVYALLAHQSIATLCRARMPTLGCAAAEPASIVQLVAAKRPCSGWRCHARQLRYVGATDQNGPGLMAQRQERGPSRDLAFVSAGRYSDPLPKAGSVRSLRFADLTSVTKRVPCCIHDCG